MKENALMKIAVICSFVGLIILFVISENTELLEVSVAGIDESDIFKDVKIKGEVIRVRENSGTLFMDIGEIKTISVVVFDNENDVDEGDYVIIEGEVREYKGRLEIIANDVKVSEKT